VSLGVFFVLDMLLIMFALL